MTSRQLETVQRSLLIIQHNKFLPVDLSRACCGFSTSLPQRCLLNTSIRIFNLLKVIKWKERVYFYYVTMVDFTVSFIKFVVCVYCHSINLVKFLHS